MPPDSTLIAFFGSNKRILKIVRRISEETGRNVRIYHHGLDDAIEPAMKAVEKDCVEAIVAYRSTADLIRKNVNVPVLSVQNFEIYRIDAVRRLVGHARRVFMPLTVHEKVDLPTFRDLFPDMEFHTGRYTTTKELEVLIRDAKWKLGCDTVLSGGLACMFSSRYKLRHYLILPHASHVRGVLDDAWAVAQSNRENELWIRRSEAIMNAVSDGILCVDLEGFITMCNRRALDLLGLRESVNGSNIASAVPELGFDRQKSDRMSYFVLQRGDRKLVFNRVPIEVRRGINGWLYTFNSARQIIAGGKIVSRALTHANRAKYTTRDYVHNSALVDDMLRRLCMYAGSDSTVLITGESGTGKEILANALHNKSPRRNRPFVSINCAALPEQLIESELFGYEGGSFTGSLKEGKAGIFETADGGTIFIDEVNSLPPNVQLLLLRTLQEKEVRRIGSETVLPLNIRVIAATNRPLIEEVRQGRMREDLFFRLNVLVLDVPPLRRHPEDIPVLARHFAEKFARSSRTPERVPDLPDSCLERLKTLSWPGNVRELEHFVERLVLLCNGVFDQKIFDTLFTAALQSQTSLTAPAGQPDAAEHAPSPSAGPAEAGKRGSADRAGRQRERIAEALALFNDRKGEAARFLGISRVTLWRLMRRYGME